MNRDGSATLLVVSHTPHHRTAEGELRGFGATVRELDVLATLFRRVVHLAPVEAGEPPASALAYAAANLEVAALPARGGPRRRDKLAIALGAPSFWRQMTRQVAAADLVHVRAPANVAWLAMMAWRWLPARPWWVKYAGNWRPEGPEPFSYRRQRAFCARSRADLRVTVNGAWPGQPPHVFTFRNPCLTAGELAAARAGGAGKELPAGGEPVRLLYVGRIEEPKGADRAIQVLAALRRSGIEARLELVGDGPLRPSLGELAASLGVGRQTALHGELPRAALAPLYQAAHFLVLPTRSSEGWPKVLAEAMAWGVLPLAGAISSIPQILAELAVGRALPPDEPESFADAVAGYLAEPGLFAAESGRAGLAAGEFTYDRYLADVRRLLADFSPAAAKTAQSPP